MILERRGQVQGPDGPSLPALFVFQFEGDSRRNRLGYTKGLAAMASATRLYTEDWVDYILTLAHPVGRRRSFARPSFSSGPSSLPGDASGEPDFISKFPILFGEKEGKIALAPNQGTRSDVPFLGIAGS